MKSSGLRAATVALTLALTGASLSPASAYPRPGATERVSVSSSGAQGELLLTSSSFCDAPAFDYIDVTPDGRYVAFASTAHNLVDRGGIPGDTNGACDVFVHDRVRGTTELVSVASSGAQGVGGGSGSPAISADGRFVSFVSNATNLVVGDTNLAPDIFVHDRKKGATQRVSVSSDGTQAMGIPTAHSAWPSISDNGRFVAFASHADNLVAGDTNNGEDIFVHDLKTGTTVRASVDSQGAQAEGGSCLFEFEEPGTQISAHVLCGGTIAPSLSRDGRFVAFSSGVANLVPDDLNRGEDVFVHDLKTGKTVRVSVASDGTEARCSTATLCIQRTINRGGGQLSADGRYVTFTSGAQNLIPNDATGIGGNDSFVHDLKTGRTERVSVTSYGGEREEGGGTWNAISPSGRYVGFTACARASADQPLLLEGCEALEVYVYDRATGVLVWASGAKNGKQSRGGSCGGLFGGTGVFSEGTAVNDRAHVAFRSCNPDLVADDANEIVDYFVRDLGPALGVGGFEGGSAPDVEPPGDRICIIPDICIPPGGWVTFGDERGDVDPVIAARGANLIGGRIVHRSLLDDLYVVLELESMPHTPALATVTAGLVYGMSFEVDGKAYEVRAASTGLGPHGETTAEFGLFSCPRGELVCTKASDLKGGFGTTGERITIAVPLADLGIKNGSAVSGVRAFSGLGSYLGLVATTLDDAIL